MTFEPIPYEASEFFKDVESQALLLTDALETGDAAYITHAFGVIAKARGMTGIAREAGVTREALYKALSEKGDPKLSTLLGVAKALGMKFTVVPASDAAE
jgi:probable addiction module antidote protein